MRALALLFAIVGVSTAANIYAMDGGELQEDTGFGEPAEQGSEEVFEEPGDAAEESEPVAPHLGEGHDAENGHAHSHKNGHPHPVQGNGNGHLHPVQGNGNGHLHPVQGNGNERPQPVQDNGNGHPHPVHSKGNEHSHPVGDNLNGQSPEEQDDGNRPLKPLHGHAHPELEGHSPLVHGDEGGNSDALNEKKGPYRSAAIARTKSYSSGPNSSANSQAQAFSGDFDESV